MQNPALDDRKLRTGAQILVDQLVIQKVDTIFCVPGESFLAVLDVLHDTPSIRLITCRHEGAAAMMAEAHGKLTGRPGVVFASRGPGTTNAAAGLHVAAQDSTPFILFIGQNGRDMMERQAFQEIDYRRMFGEQCKMVVQIDDAARVSEFVTRAFHTTISGRPGPAVIALPEDMLRDHADAQDGAYCSPPLCAPSPNTLSRVSAALATAERPLVVVGGGDWNAAGVAGLTQFLETTGLACCPTFRRQDKLDNNHPSYIGELGLGINPKLAQRVRDADLLLVIGAKLGDICTQGYELLSIPRPTQQLIHIYPDPDEFAHVFQPDLAIVARPGEFCEHLGKITTPGKASWSEQRQQARDEFEAWTAGRETVGELQMCEVVKWLDESLPADTIYTNGAGNFSVWLHRFHRYRQLGTQLAPVSGSMGYGVPAALAAKLAHPNATVICFAGDGDFQMTGAELATAVENKLNLRILIINNNMLGTIRMHQERSYPGRVSGTDLGNPDFVKLAQAYGAYGERVNTAAEFVDAFLRADAFEGPSVLELVLDPETISPNFSLSELRAKS